MSNEDVYDVIVLGGGPSGISCAYHCTRTNLRTIWLDTHCELHGGGGVSISPEMEPGYYLINRRRKIGELTDQKEKYDLKVVPTNSIDKINANDTIKEVFTDKGIYKANVLVFATTLPGNKYKIEGEEEYLGNGLYTSIPDKVDFRGKHVIVLGSGSWAVRNGLYIDEKGAKVSLISCCLLGNIHTSLRKRLEISFIRTFENYQPKKYEGVDGKLCSVTFDLNGRTVKLEEIDIIVLTGCVCASRKVFDEAGIKINDSGRFTTIGSNGQTALQGVYAVGLAVSDNIPIGALDSIGLSIGRTARNYLEILKEKLS